MTEQTLTVAQDEVAGTIFRPAPGTPAKTPALLLADRHPGAVRGAVLYAPNDAVAQGFPDGGHAWTQGGRPIPEGPIAVDGAAGPVPAVAGAMTNCGPR